MDSLVLAILLGVVALVYATVGQAGGTAFLAVMAALGPTATDLRPTALALNVLAASITTWQFHRVGAVDWRLLSVLGLPSLPAAFIGGLVVLEARPYFLLVGVALLAAAACMIGRPARKADRPHRGAALAAGGSIGFLSGVTGVGGGVFLAPVLVAAGWATARQAAGLSAPFILANSAVALAGSLLAGEQLSASFGIYALAVVAGAVAGAAIGLRLFSERVTRFVLAAILATAGLKLIAQ